MLKNKLTRFFFSPLVLRSSQAARVAYVALFTALAVVANSFLEFRIYDVQYSVTIFLSTVTGVFLGPLLGFSACFLGDFTGFLLASQGQTYMPWVGLSTATFAFLAGFILRYDENSSRLSTALSFLVYAVVSFFVCTVGINSTGFYIFNKTIGFSPTVLEYFSDRFGGSASFFGYCAYRLIFKLQILNSVLNYALVFAVVPLLFKVKGLRKYL